MIIDDVVFGVDAIECCQFIDFDRQLGVKLVDLFRHRTDVARRNNFVCDKARDQRSERHNCIFYEGFCSLIHLLISEIRYPLSDICINGARVPGVDEPAWLRFQALIEIEFEEVAEPKALLLDDLLRVVNKYGTHAKAAAVIGASEAFVRQKCFKRPSPELNNKN